MFGDVLNISVQLIVVIPDHLQELHRPLGIERSTLLYHLIAIMQYAAIPPVLPKKVV
jgi:hypothetical protein